MLMSAWILKIMKIYWYQLWKYIDKATVSDDAQECYKEMLER